MLLIVPCKVVPAPILIVSQASFYLLYNYNDISKRTPQEDHISQMMSLVSYLEEYHQNSLSVMSNLKKELSRA